MEFSPVQQKIIDTRDVNLTVSASAGSGKTAVLVERLVQLVIQDRVSISSILAVTFTEDAARELKERLKKALMEQDQSDPWMKQQLTLLEDASISTIHSFCLGLIQEFYYRIPISYTRASSVDNGIEDQAALQKAYQRAMDSLRSEQAAALQLYLDSYSQTPEDLQSMVLKLLDLASSKPDGKAWLKEARGEMPDLNKWFLHWFFVRLKAMQEACTRIENALMEAEFKKESERLDWLAVCHNKQQAIETCLQALEKGSYSEFRSAFEAYIDHSGKLPNKVRDTVFEEENKLLRKSEQDIAARLFSQEQFDERRARQQILYDTLIDLALACQTYFEEEKDRLQIIDYADMEQLAWKLMQNEAVRKEIQDRYQTVLIDEYQDTSDLQDAILSTAGAKGTVFRVGDLKQSIYGFRNARPALMKAHMEKQDEKNQVMVMNENYRSWSGIVDFVNEFFGILMNSGVLSSQFAEQDKAISALPDQPEVQPPVRFLYTAYHGWEDPEREKTTDLQARKVHLENRLDLIARDILKKQKEGTDLRNIAILTRSNTPHEKIKEVLDLYGIRSLTQIRKGFWVNQAVQIIMSLLRILDDPRDDIAMMAALCSPIGRKKQLDVLPLIMNRPQGQSIYDTLRNHPMMDFYREILPWKSLPLGELVRMLYGYRNFYMDSTTENDKTNLDLLLEKALQAQEQMDLSAFVQASFIEQNLNRTGEAASFGREENAVRISSIHASKGLQYDVVYLLGETTVRDMAALSPVTLDTDLGLALAGLSEDRRLKSVSRAQTALESKRLHEDIQERMRLFYVAATRARKELVMVDTIKSLDDYKMPLGWNTLLYRKTFTSWLLSVYLNNPQAKLLKLEEAGMVERPQPKKPKYYKKTIPQYTGPRQIIANQTASAAKKQLCWKPVERGSSRGRERGTFFHRMADELPWPYALEDMENFAAQNRETLDNQDKEQFLSLNQCPQYARWMELPHEFECAYTVREHGAIVHGYMDLVAFDGDVIDILDFKTDHVMDMIQLKERYHGQLETYARAMKQIYPEKTIRTWIYSFSLQELGEITPPASRQTVSHGPEAVPGKITAAEPESAPEKPVLPKMIEAPKSSEN